MKKNIGKGIDMPKEKCKDENCPFHGSLKCRGRIFSGTVLSAKMRKTAVIEWTWKYYLPKYERYEKRRTKLKVHNPLCINAKNGDIVKIMECRPLSKTKHFVIVSISGKERGFKEKMEALEEAKVKKEKEEEVKEDIKENEAIKSKNN